MNQLLLAERRRLDIIGASRSDLRRWTIVAARTAQETATVGVAEYGNSAVLVTVASNHALLDRRTVDLTRDLPTHPYHHEGSWAVGRYLNSSWSRATSLPEAVALIERVHLAADLGARRHLRGLAETVAVPIARIAIRECPRLPPTITERINDTRSANVADSVMYRLALASAAAECGWTVHWYDRARVAQAATAALRGRDLDVLLSAMGRSTGPPWQAKHRLAAAAAIAAAMEP